MSEKNGSKRCPRCGISKIENIGNFKKRRNAKEFSVWCRGCLDIETAKRYRERKAKDNEYRVVKCYNPDCDETFTGKRVGAMYCSHGCKIKMKLENAKNNRQELKLVAKKEIDPKWLVRGKIHGVHY